MGFNKGKSHEKEQTRYDARNPVCGACTYWL